ncbi:MAG: DUF4831 family protein [Alistipes sp.]
MKQILLTLTLLMAVVTVTAQNPYLMVLGAQETTQGVVISQPHTLLSVDLTVEKETVLCGPYARYALKYLGVSVPFTDKTTYTLLKASVAMLDEEKSFLAQRIQSPRTHTYAYDGSETGFAALQPDRLDGAPLSLEDAARAAATTIFSLRKHRLDLITGEAGENVFGEGLKSALKEIAHQEQAYLELFLGKRTLTTEMRRYVITPNINKRQYLICRFSESDGLLSDKDLSGEIVLLQITPGEPAAIQEASPKESLTVECRLAAPSVCTLFCGNQELTQTTLPLFEFGRTVRIALPRKK